MVIAIDESGSFNYQKDAELRHFFIAAFLRSRENLLDIKKSQFGNWEAKIENHKREKTGEIKGSLLSPDDLKNFLLEVVVAYPTVKFSCVSIVPRNITVPLINKYKEFEALLLKHSARQGSGFSKKSTNIINGLASWVGKRNEIEYTKMTCLSHCLMNSLSNAFVYSIATDNEMEFLDIEFKIDRDFINNENINWKEYSLKKIEQYSKSKPFPMLNTWDENHPIIKKYIIDGKGINLRTAFEEQSLFLDSKENFEVRVADIIGIILQRYFNRREEQYSILFELLEKTAAVKNYHIEIRLNDFTIEQKFKEFTGLPYPAE